MSPGGSHSAAAAPPGAAPPRSILEDVVGYWELRRIPYNLALVAVAIFAVARTWPHFRPAFVWGSVPPLAVLATLANLCYCAAYFAEALVPDPPSRAVWRRKRWILWVVGTLFAMVFELYWILDEISPAVGEFR